MAKILLVEDEFIVLDVLKQFLENEEHNVFVATTGKDALHILADQKGAIDLVLLDLTLPDMNGIDLLPKMIDNYPSVKLVICSGTIPDDLEIGEGSFIRGLLSKPFTLSEFRKVIELVLKE